MRVSRGNHAGPAAALMVFCVFTMSVLAVLMLGVSSYRNMTDISREGGGERVCLSYIWTKVKNGDSAGKVYLDEFQGIPALVIEEEYDGTPYLTVIYSYEGQVCELFTEAGLDFAPEDGAPVVENESLSFEQPDSGLIKVSAGSESAFISLRGKMGVTFAEGGAVN